MPTDTTITRYGQTGANQGFALVVRPDGPWVRYEDHERALTAANAALAECYRLTGADPDGNEDWRLATNAVAEVKRLREESDAEIAAANAARDAALEAARYANEVSEKALDETAAALGSPAPAPLAPPVATCRTFLSGETLAALDPGIRDLVNGLNVAGFKTTDSGDGCSKAAAIAAGEALPFRHVACAVSRDALFSEADRLLAVLGAGWTVEASYHPPEGQCVLFAREESSDVPGAQPPPVDAVKSSAVALGIVTVSHGAAQRCASGHNYRRNAPPQDGDVCYVCRSAVWRRGMAPHEGEPHDMAADPGLD